MTEPRDSELHVPTLAELRASVVPRRAPADAPGPAGTPAAPTPYTDPDPSKADRLTPLAEALLRDAVEPHHRAKSLEERWTALGITSGSRKSRILNELRRHGFIRIERKGRTCVLHLYRKAYEYLGLKAPTGEGGGGTTHRALAKRTAPLLTNRDYEVYIEQEVGPKRKRVDLVAYGRRRIGVEIGLSDAHQELKNLREDLASGVLDAVLFVTIDAALLEKVRALALSDPAVAPNLHRVHFLLLKEDAVS